MVTVAYAIAAGYLIGALAGYAASRGNRIAAQWRRLIRVQLLCVSAVLSFLAAWRLPAAADLIWPAFVTIIAIALVGVAYLLTPNSSERVGRAVLRGWSSIPNPGFWVVPLAAAIAGPVGLIVAVFIDRVMIFFFGFFVWILRRQAPIKQQMRTSWIDQSPLIALLIGLVLNAFTQPPAWTGVVLVWSVPLLAAIGAAMFVGSVLHPSQQIPWRPGIRVWLLLIAMRIALLVPLVLIAPNAPIAAVLVLCAFSIPAFYPPQLSVLYGYADSVVAAASRLGWVFAPVGVLLALAIMRT
ncbi:MAG: hypothetical protein NWR17_10500 [Candidatus Nanopelagicales bacterium]|nr:hypothetical protein [Candidatus Nanopelagicales bacterium]MDP4715714.1 hypothetical protein [Candidatus Nanopelagicales bacterium]MDP4907675.1 hypothetical protein [Candidatus Nanopelagicales bacterium]MDP4975668.1 hypothetical protein [Candidatus Nanopelagicales bacterium]MDP5094665.1 hypothetical protein [Candidatus Nanopelagicales bacterium]